MSARDEGAVYPTPFLTQPDVAFYDGNNLLCCLKWRQVDMVKVRFRGHQGYQAGVGSIVVRTRDDVSGARSELRSDGAAVTLMAELLSCGAMLPEHNSMFSYRCRGKVVTWQYNQAINAIRYLVWSRRENWGNSHGILFELGGAQHLRQGRVVPE